MYEKIQETASWLKERMTTSPKTAIILGTGLGQLASEITDSYEFYLKALSMSPPGAMIQRYSPLFPGTRSEALKKFRGTEIILQLLHVSLCIIFDLSKFQNRRRFRSLGNRRRL